jgi:hypothetical protein
MKRCVVLTLCLAACAQQPAPSFDPQSGGPETASPDALKSVPRVDHGIQRLQRESTGVEAQSLGVGTGLVIRPIKVVGGLSFEPSNATTVSDVREITVTFDVDNAASAQTAAAEFVAPSGLPYQRNETQVGVAPPSTDHLSFTLPVAATAIDSNKLSGTWAVNLVINGATVATQNFELLQ